MMPSPAPTRQPAAVAAFLRGVDRRARLLALVQTADTADAQAALAVAGKVFVTEAGQWPIAHWPAQYWRLLLSVPAMGHRTHGGDRFDVLPDVARLTPPLRAAVLLHLVAGLEDIDAAAALGLGVGAYQQRIRNSLPRNAQDELDFDVWRGWREAAQQALEQLPEIAEATLSPPLNTTPPPRATGSAADLPAKPDHRRRRPWIWLVLALLALAMALVAALFLHANGRALIDAWRHQIHVEALPAAAPKARFDPRDASLDPDRDMLAAADELALARRLPLLAWLAADAAELMPAAADVSRPAITAVATPGSPLDRAQLRRNRGAWAEWHVLPASERSALRAVAARFDALPQTQQRALIDRYARQSFDAHRGWHLGPQLGAAWPRIAALFTYIDAGERQPLLDLLRSASSDEVDALARLAQSTPPEARSAFRRALLAQPPAQREVWLQLQLQH